MVGILSDSGLNRLIYLPTDGTFRYFNFVTDSNFLFITSNVWYRLILESIDVSKSATTNDSIVLNYMLIYRNNGFEGSPTAPTARVDVKDYLKSGYTGAFFDRGSSGPITISDVNNDTLILNNISQLYPGTSYPPNSNVFVQDQDESQVARARIYFQNVMIPALPPPIGTSSRYDFNFRIERAQPVFRVSRTRIRYDLIHDSQFPNVDLPMDIPLTTDGHYQISLVGNSFSFLGKEYPAVRIGANGLIDFTGPSTAPGQLIDLYNAFATPRLMVFWSQLKVVPLVTKASYQLDDDQLVVLIRNLDFKSDPSRYNSFRVSLSLNQGKYLNDIEITYGRLHLHPKLKSIVGVTDGPSYGISPIPKPVVQTNFTSGGTDTSTNRGYLIQEFPPSPADEHPLSFTRLTMTSDH